jgi:hypothetical protein
MRRGLLKDMANTPTQIVCGYRLYGDLARLSRIAGSVIVIDLLQGRATVDGAETTVDLDIARDATAWVQERLERDQVPPGTIDSATLTLLPRVASPGLLVDCRTILESRGNVYESHDTARWHRSDVSDIANS